MSHKKKIAFFPLTPLGDAVVAMGILDELHRIYAPCEITIFAVPLIAELYRGYLLCSKSIELEENSDGEVFFRQIPQEHFDVVFNHGYSESWNRLLEQLDYDNAYGMEEPCRPPEKCKELFTQWVSSEYWNTVTLKKHQKVSEQMAELIRLVDPTCQSIQPTLSSENYTLTSCMIPQSKYILMLPGASSIEKCWPIGKFLQLAKILTLANYQVFFVTGPAERHLEKKIKTSGFMYFNTPKLSNLAYCIAHADAVIGNDSGPMHMAACFNRPTIHFFSFSGAETWFQYDHTLHKLVMPVCGRKSEKSCVCSPCHRTCIGKITVKQAYRACRDILELPEIKFKKIGYFATQLIGDSLVAINHLEKISELYNPCEITVFCDGKNSELFDNYAYCEQVVQISPNNEFDSLQTQDQFEAIFNTRYDLKSIELLAKLQHRSAYGFENVEIPQKICQQQYEKWVPLSAWDDVNFRYNTSVSELSSTLIRLIDPGYHLAHSTLQRNTFVHDYNIAGKYLCPNLVIFVPGASDRHKHWGNSNYLAIAANLKELKYNCLFLLGSNEMDYEDEICRAGFRTALNMQFAGVAALFNSPVVKCVIGNDTGLMHLACSLNVPTITISPGDFHYVWQPYSREKHRVCHSECSNIMCSRYCKTFSNCISKITPEQVINECMSLFCKSLMIKHLHFL